MNGAQIKFGEVVFIQIIRQKCVSRLLIHYKGAEIVLVLNVISLQQAIVGKHLLKKAVRAAVVLLPLLGITNFVNMMEAPLDRQVWEFALWSYTTHFLTSFQGTFVAALYCFMNGEVRTVIRKSIYTYLLLRPAQFTPRRNSAYVSVGGSRPPDPPPETRV